MPTSPETVLFAVDLDPAVGSDVGCKRSRLDVIKHAITNVVLAKKWTCSLHKFGLITIHQDSAVLLPLSLTSSTGTFLEAVRALQPAAAPKQPDPSSSSSSSSNGSNSSKPFDLGALIAVAAPLQQAAASKAAQYMHGGTLHSHGSSSNDSSSSSGGNAYAGVRVVLVYCRSQLPAPVWSSHQQQGLAIDCLHVHDKPQPGEQQQQLQEVYSTLEGLVDRMALRVGHASLIYETTAKNLGKLLSCMAMMISHPMQRRPQVETKPPVDLASAPLQPLPSDAANAASGVPIMLPGNLPAPATGSAWAKPRSAAALASASGPLGAAALGGGVGPAAAGDAGNTWLGLGNPQHQRGPSSQQQQGVADPWAAGSSLEATRNVWQQQELIDMSSAGTSTAAAAAGVSSRSSPERPQSGAGCSSSNSVVTGVPAKCVTGLPDEFEPMIAMDLAEGVVMGFDINRTSSSSSAAGIYGSNSTSYQASNAPGTGPATAEDADEGLGGLADSLMTAAVEDKEAAAYYPRIP